MNLITRRCIEPCIRIQAIRTCADLSPRNTGFTVDNVHFRGDDFTNVTQGIYSKVGRRLHHQENHPIKMIKDSIFKFFQESYPGASNMDGVRLVFDWCCVILTCCVQHGPWTINTLLAPISFTTQFFQAPIQVEGQRESCCECGSQF